MKYLGRFTAEVELKKLARGKKSNMPLPAEIIAYEALRSRPDMQRKLAKSCPVVREWASSQA